MILMALAGASSSAQAPAAAPPQVPVDNGRAMRLYVPTDPQGQSVGRDFQRDVREREADDARYVEACKGRMECRKVVYRSRIGGLEVPAYLFQPLHLRGAKGHAAMVW